MISTSKVQHMTSVNSIGFYRTYLKNDFQCVTPVYFSKNDYYLTNTNEIRGGIGKEEGGVGI